MHSFDQEKKFDGRHSHSFTSTHVVLYIMFRIYFEKLNLTAAACISIVIIEGKQKNKLFSALLASINEAFEGVYCV